MTWVPTKDELAELILPSDTRYYQWGFSGWSEPFKEERRQIVDQVSLFLQSDILKVAPKEIPASLPAKLPRAILASRTDLSPEDEERIFSYLNAANRVGWCHHDPEGGYIMAKLLAHKYEARLLRGWKVASNPWYGGYKADVGLVNPSDECVIALEIGDMLPSKLVDPFHNRGFKELWHWPYYGWSEQRKYEWQKDEVYWIWTRGRRWGQPLLSAC